MNKSVSLVAITAIAGVALALSACSRSGHPAHDVTGSSAESSPASAPAPTKGAFATLPDAAPTGSVTQNCNLDAVDGAPAGSKTLSTAGSALFAGWAANGNESAVPAKLELVLADGAHVYGVSTSTGVPRADIVKATGKPALARAGYAVSVGMAKVAAGTYTVELRYHVDGKAWICKTVHSVTVG